ncbi:sigma-70 family RNA polymerase sigma factor [Dactylosporangium vinaceum]|uniref:Sigma-70 family RNA polymerase sigma factor n=1 Tax=Dactylosporangium vinaceum TaxID=53362 RepID=A0ABV5MNY7_9ACTN|nr:sigma-70 family RNA polymerase sigma factor [Dactylosporangium vinaceum]UAB95719.1 sigma-70 family RNA polymerase sigma factor [Dactylosporangium vinaceum]
MPSNRRLLEPDFADDLDRARKGDDDAFARLVAPLRGQLHAHCYRMLGSVHDADDALQDALVRAWLGLGGYQSRGSLRAWLFTVATRTCLDLIAARGRRALPIDLGPASDAAAIAEQPRNDVAWLEPYPDVVYERRETVELAFVAALQHLPGNQRAALLLFEVLGFTAAEIAEIMATTAGSVNSALARARRTLAEKVPPAAQQPTLRRIGDERIREIVAAYATALEHGDAAALVALLTEDVTWSMPPLPSWYHGLPAVTDFAVRLPLSTCGSWRHLATFANAQPAIACYRRPEPEGPHTAWSLNVLTLRADRIAEITSFLDPALFARFDLPMRL